MLLLGCRRVSRVFLDQMVRILLIRHGESTGNRDHIWAGITDNELTNHGHQQAQRLAHHLQKVYGESSKEEAYQVKAVYCSDLKRARRTASAIAENFDVALTVTTLLREQDLGWREGRSLKDGDRSAPKNVQAMQENPGESKADMDLRAVNFRLEMMQAHIDEFLQPNTGVDVSHSDNTRPLLVIVSHGLFLLRLYYHMVEHFRAQSAPSVSWSNTGCTTLTIDRTGFALVNEVNSITHLTQLKRTRAGVGSSEYDERQQKVSDFFVVKRNKLRRESIPLLQAPESRASHTGLVVRTVPLQPQTADVEVDEDLQAQIDAIDAACG